MEHHIGGFTILAKKSKVLEPLAHRVTYTMKHGTVQCKYGHSTKVLNERDFITVDAGTKWQMDNVGDSNAELFCFMSTNDNTT